MGLQVTYNKSKKRCEIKDPGYEQRTRAMINEINDKIDHSNPSYKLKKSFRKTWQIHLGQFGTREDGIDVTINFTGGTAYGAFAAGAVFTTVAAATPVGWAIFASVATTLAAGWVTAKLSEKVTGKLRSRRLKKDITNFALIKEIGSPKYEAAYQKLVGNTPEFGFGVLAHFFPFENPPTMREVVRSLIESLKELEHENEAIRTEIALRDIRPSGMSQQEKINYFSSCYETKIRRAALYTAWLKCFTRYSRYHLRRPSSNENVEVDIWNLVSTQVHGVFGQHDSCDKYCLADVDPDATRESFVRAEQLQKQQEQLQQASKVDVSAAGHEEPMAAEVVDEATGKDVALDAKVVGPKTAHSVLQHLEAEHLAEVTDSIEDNPRLTMTTVEELADINLLEEAVDNLFPYTAAMLPGADPVLVKEQAGNVNVYGDLLKPLGDVGGNLATGAVGSAVGMLFGTILSYGMEYFKERKPLERKMKKFALGRKVDQVAADRFFASIKDISEVDMLVKEVVFYRNRYRKRFEKFHKKFMDVMRGPNRAPYPRSLVSCDEAVLLTRYFLKVEHIADKYEAYLTYADIYVDSVRQSLFDEYAVPAAATDTLDGFKDDDVRNVWGTRFAELKQPWAIYNE